MKKCDHEGCNEQIDDKYKMCYAHHVAPNKIPKAIPESLPAGAWHSDPVVDALLKINNNLSAIKRILEKTPVPSGTATFKKGTLAPEENEYVSEDV